MVRSTSLRAWDASGWITGIATRRRPPAIAPIAFVRTDSVSDFESDASCAWASTWTTIIERRFPSRQTTSRFSGGRQRAPATVPLGRLVLIALVSLLGGCRGQNGSLQPIYDPATGKLELLKYDANGNGTVDTWSYMDGRRILRIEVDGNEDGKLDRWEYYDANQRLEKVGTSRLADGVEDTWLYPGADGAAARLELSTRRDGGIDRTEYYVKSILVRAEEDSDGDRKIDKWETYADGRLSSVAFDTTRRGKPDRRLVYGADGSATVEVDATGSGEFMAVKSPRR
jgi:hypothetical protein